MSAAETIVILQKENPDVVRLAESVAFATMIDHAFLRAARLALVPPVDAGAEADLWFSPIVQSRTGDGIVFDPEAADLLRSRMDAARVEEVWTLTSREHAWLAPSLRLEEEIAYLSVSRKATASDELADRLRSVLAAMVSGDRAGLAQWAARALSMFPSRVLALPEARMLETGTRLRLGETLDPTGDDAMPSWMPWVAPASLGEVSLDFTLHDQLLEIRTTTEETLVGIPATNPLVLEVSSLDAMRRRHTQQITFRVGETVPVAVGRGEVILRSITGNEYALRESDYVSERLREEIVDFSREMERHKEVRDRTEEIEQVLAMTLQQTSIAVTGETGVGKTAFLCELIRVAESRGTTVIKHFFRFGDLRMESIASAERSLIAQLAVRFAMPENVLDLRLSEVLERLRFHRLEAEALLIVLDDIDDARNVDRMVDENAMETLLPVVPWGHVVFSAVRVKTTAEALFPLRRTARMEDYDAEFARSLQIPLTEGILSLAAIGFQPLPPAVLGFDRSADDWPDGWRLRSEGDVFFLDSAAQQLVLNALNAPIKGPTKLGRAGKIRSEIAASLHAELVRRLEEFRDDEKVERYYLLNAPMHLLLAKDEGGARSLCTNFEFMRKKIETFGVDSLIADLIALPRASRPNNALLRALQASAAAIRQNPQDLVPILYSAFVELGMPTEGQLPMPPFVPSLITPGKPKRLHTRKHDGAVCGSAWFGKASDHLFSLVTWSDDGMVKIWNSDRLNPPTEMVHAAAVTAFAWGGSEAITADANGSLHLWDVGRATRLSRVAAHDRAIDGIVVDVSRHLIISWSGNDPIRLWSWAPREPALRPAGELSAHASYVVGCALLEGRLVSVSSGGTCRLWDLDHRIELSVIPLPVSPTGIAMHVDSAALIVMTTKRTFDVVMATQSSLVKRDEAIPTGHTLPVSGVTISPDGAYAASWSEDHTIRLWPDPASRFRLPPRVLEGHRAAVTSCRFSPSGMHLVSADAAGAAIVWDPQSGAIVSRFDGHLQAIRTIAIEPTNAVFTAGDDGIVLEWSLVNGELIADHSVPPGRVAECVVMVGDEPRALTTDGESKFEVQPTSRFGPYRLQRPLLAASPTTAFVCGARESGPYVLELTTGVPYQHTKRSHPGEICALAINANQLLAIGTTTGQLFDGSVAGSWTLLGSHAGPISALTFASPAIVVAASLDGMLTVWADRTTQQHRIQAHRSRIHALDALGTTAVTGSANGTLRVWNLESGSAIASISRAHDAAITAVRMAGNIVVSTSLDGTVRVFDYKLGTLLAICRGHTDTITGVAIAMEDEAIYSCAEDRTIRKWDIATGEQTAIVYGSAPFRCLSLRHGTLIAGDDGGALWTVREPEIDPRIVSSTRPRVYISFIDRDRDLALRLREHLEQSDVSVLMTVNDLPLSERTQMRSLISRATHVLFILSESAALSDRIRIDTEVALNSQQHVLPIVIDRGQSWHRSKLYRYKAVDLSGRPTEERYRRGLVEITDFVGRMPPQ